MKTTLDLPENLLRQAKSRAALKGQPMKAFFIAAVEAQLAAEVEPARRPAPPAWLKHFGVFKKQAAALHCVQAVIDEEFSRIDPKDWK